MSKIVYVEKVSDTEKVVMKRSGRISIEKKPFLFEPAQPLHAKDVRYTVKHYIKVRVFGFIPTWKQINSTSFPFSSAKVPPYKSVVRNLIDDTYAKQSYKSAEISRLGLPLA